MTAEEFQKKFGIIGKSKKIRDLVDIVMQVAQSDISILIYGESGTGKEVFARAIHGFSKRANKPLVSVNCGAIPEGILESELFGHTKGSFTGAIDNRKGYFEIANGGTLFLDEIAEMPLTTQVKLLRALETKEFMRIGSETVTRVDVRILAATNKDLQREVEAKRFRNDLYFRLKAVTINIPPLRSRKEDIPLLVNHFLREYSIANKTEIRRVSDQAMELLMDYDWPGNIRELKNTIESAATLSRSELISADVVAKLLIRDFNDSPRNLPMALRKSPETTDREMIFGALIEIKKDLVELKNLAYESTHNTRNFQTNNGEIKPIWMLERDAIINALNKFKWNKKKTAEALEISERTLYRKLKEYGIR